MPLLYLSLSFLSGVVTASLLPLPAMVWFGGSLLGLLIAGGVFFLRQERPESRVFVWFAGWLPQRVKDTLSPSDALLMVCFLVAAFTLGAGRYQSTRPLRGDPTFIASHNDRDEMVTVTGILVAPPDVRDAYIQLRVDAEQLRPRDSIYHQRVRGLILARTEDTTTPWHYGDRVLLTGQLQTPPESESFSYRAYLERQGVYAFMPRAKVTRLESGQGNRLLAGIFALKQRAFETIHQLYPDPEASLLAGILLGMERGIPLELQDAFRDTGTAHIIAISGFNITIIAGLFMTLLRRFLGRRWGVLAAVGGIAGYTVLVGADAAVVRAALMGGLTMFAHQLHRRGAAFNALAVTAAVMVFFNPLLPWDVGFQLSFAATLGLVLYAEPLTTAFVGLASRWMSFARAQRLAGPVGEFFLFTLAAQITTLPVTIYHFRRFSLISFFANPLILPVQPAVMVFGGLVMLLGMVSLPLGRLLAPFALVFVTYTIRVVEWMAAIPLGVVLLGNVSLWAVGLIYALVLGLTLVQMRFPQRMGSLFSPLGLVVVSLLTAVTWRAALSAPDGLLHLTMLDVGTGDALLIETPTGRWVLIDGGSSAVRLSDALGRRIPPFQRELDYLLVAAPFEGQLAALPQVIERFPPQEVLWAGPANASRAASFLQESLAKAGLPVVNAQPGQVLELGGEATLRVLTTGRRGAILLLEKGFFRALLPVGADYAELEALGMGERVGVVSVLMLAEEGMASLNPAQWIAHLNPQVVLLSVDAGNRQGLPSPETLAALEGYTLLRTDRNGWVEVATDGEEMWVEVERALSCPTTSGCW